MTGGAPTTDYEQLTNVQRTTWARGDFHEIARHNVVMAERLCEAIDLHAGERVLDVACGTGTAALVAARRYCDVTGVDFVPQLPKRTELRARAEGYAIKPAYRVVGVAIELLARVRPQLLEPVGIHLVLCRFEPVPAGLGRDHVRTLRGRRCLAEPRHMAVQGVPGTYRRRGSPHRFDQPAGGKRRRIDSRAGPQGSRAGSCCRGSSGARPQQPPAGPARKSARLHPTA